MSRVSSAGSSAHGTGDRSPQQTRPDDELVKKPAGAVQDYHLPGNLLELKQHDRHSVRGQNPEAPHVPEAVSAQRVMGGRHLPEASGPDGSSIPDPSIGSSPHAPSPSVVHSQGESSPPATTSPPVSVPTLYGDPLVVETASSPVSRCGAGQYHQGASVSDICDAAVWATPHTFTRFYRLNVLDPQNPAFGTRVVTVAYHLDSEAHA
ncbi:UNVERIFIED_CONTAM: hypothetical protein FKN15_058273 [Acipenser sinensis]